MKSKLLAWGLGLIQMLLILSVWIVSGCGETPLAIKTAVEADANLTRYTGTGVRSGAPSLPFACTSFAVYSDATFYGMNFDYPDVEIRFTLRPSGGMRVFQMEFSQEGDFVPTVGMNSAGLFASCQMLYPEAPAKASPGPNDVYPWQVYRESLANFDSVQDVTEFVADKKVVHWTVTLHDLFADVRGDAMVVAPGDEENVITKIQDDFIVMTNFANGDFVGQSYENVAGAGADRYKIAYANILEHITTFDVDRGLETLEKAVMSGEAASTQASMVFDPKRGEVYIALKGDFNKIWKVSIAEGTVETFAGFGRAEKARLDSSGVLASDLERMGASSGVPWGYYGVGFVLVLMVGGLYFSVIRKRSQTRRQDVLTASAKE